MRVRIKPVVGELVTHPDHTFRFHRFVCAPHPGNWHRHPQVELTWIESGSGIRYVGDNATPYTDGDLALIGPNLPHIWDVTQPDVYDINVTVIQFSPELLAHPAMPELAALRGVLDRAGLGLRLDGRCKEEVARLLTAMRGLGPVMRLSAFIALLAALGDNASDMTAISSSRVRDIPPPLPERDSRVKKVLEWIHGNLSSPLRVEDAAALACVSPGAFSRFFRRETGKAFSRYVSDARCSAACLRLTRSAAPVALIAEQSGYATLSNFNRQFLERMGVTPREFRARYKVAG